MRRVRLSALLTVALVGAALPASTAARTSRPVIKGEEVGYFGSATVAHRVTVFVYSTLGPSGGNHVRVCLGGRCERAHGHNATLAWYSASFRTRGLRMGQPVRFTATASDPAGESTVTVTKGLLCMHNNGSTPQS
jgi:hypothetical protein